METDNVLLVKILEYLSPLSTTCLSAKNYSELLTLAAGDEHILTTHLFYLEGHGFIEPRAVIPASPKPMLNVSKLRITVSGQDFLMKDGGLTAIKKTVTVRFHADALKLIESALLKSALNPQDKSSAITRLKGLPFSAIEHLTMKLLDLGLGNLPGAVQLIQSVLR